jgi:putative spermidine/putrescine transport system substrate-binding protein
MISTSNPTFGEFSMKRRSFLKLAAASTAAFVAPAILRAQSKRFDGVTLNINGYGGDYDRLTMEYIAKPLEQRTGLKVNIQASESTSALAQALASRNNPPFDIILTDSPIMPQLIKADLIDPISAKDLPSLGKLLPNVREFGDYGIPFLTNAIILTYNSKLVKEPVTSYADLRRSDLKGHVGMLSPANSGGVLALIALAESNSGSLDDIGPGLQALTSMRESIATITPATTTLQQLLEQEEVWAAPFFDGRIYASRNRGKPLVSVVPKEGIYAVNNYWNPVKGGKKREAVFAYIEQAVSDEAIGHMVEFFRYAPCTDVKVSPEVAKDVVVYGDNRKYVKPVDWSKVAQFRGDWIERFDKAMR